jgi:hypothetical protein
LEENELAVKELSLICDRTRRREEDRRIQNIDEYWGHSHIVLL